MGNPEDYLDDRVKMVRLNLKKVGHDVRLRNTDRFLDFRSSSIEIW